MKRDIIIRWNGGEKQVTVDNTESAFFKAVGQAIPLLRSFPNTITVNVVGVPYCSLSLDVKKRGSYIEDGIEYDSPHIGTLKGDFSMLCLAPSKYPEVMMYCVHPESNNYKFYHFLPNDVNGITTAINAEYGRLGTQKGEMFGIRTLKNPYASHLFWPLYYEKLAKGYEDVSDIILFEQKPVFKDKNDAHKAPQTPSAKLYAILSRLARKTVQEALEKQVITKRQVEVCKQLLEKMRQTDDVSVFNNILRKLVCFSARKARYISDVFANSTNDFQAILDREENLLNAMEMVVNSEQGTVEDFDRFGVEVYDPYPWQEAHVRKRIPQEFHTYLKYIFRVVPKERQEAFNAYTEREHLTDRDIHEKWHGSRNANWGSETGILPKGLRLRNDAVKTGNMLGLDPALYFADSERQDKGFYKSKGYTSWDDAYWTSDSSNIAVMGIFAVATGNIYKQVSSVHPVSKEFLKKNGYHCTEAFKGAQMRNGRTLRDSEIAIFNEDACVCRYICIFEK